MAGFNRIIQVLKKIKQWFMGSYPLAKYHFRVEWGGGQVSFSEVSGLSMEIAVVEYREGGAPDGSVIKLPGLRKYSNLVLKRGIRKNDQDFINWLNTVKQGAAERRDVLISLLNEAHEPVVSWKVHNAWPCKYEVAGLHASAGEVLIEILELAHEGFSVVS